MPRVPPITGKDDVPAEHQHVVDDVLGVKLPVFAQRHRSLRDMLIASARHGDAGYFTLGEYTLTFADNLARSASVAAALRDHLNFIGRALAVTPAPAVVHSRKWIGRRRIERLTMHMPMRRRAYLGRIPPFARRVVRAKDSQPDCSWYRWRRNQRPNA